MVQQGLLLHERIGDTQFERFSRVQNLPRFQKYGSPLRASSGSAAEADGMKATGHLGIFPKLTTGMAPTE
jgi:hypothetical protein